MSHWYPALIIVVSVGLWGVMACECDDVTFVMSLWCQDDVKITLCQYSNSTGLWHSSIHQSEGRAEDAAANQQPPISDIEKLIPVDNMLVWSSLVISRTTDRLCELLLDPISRVTSSYQASFIFRCSIPGAQSTDLKVGTYSCYASDLKGNN